jgi:hypothetical protein
MAAMNQSTISEEPRNKAFDNKENPPIKLWISVAKCFFLAKRHLLQYGMKSDNLLKCATAGFLCTWEFNRNKRNNERKHCTVAKTIEIIDP